MSPVSGWREFKFVGGALDGQTRLLPEPPIESYAVIGSDQEWRWDEAADAYVLVEP